MKKFHGGDIVDIDLGFEYHDEPLAIHFHRQHRSREDQLADRALSLGPALALEPGTTEELTLVLTICNFRGLFEGWVSAVPTRATSEVQNSISTTPVAP